MTEAEWLAATDPQRLLEHLRGKVTDRMLRLFAVACCRWTFTGDSVYRQEEAEERVELAERIAEGEAPPSDPLTHQCELHGIFYAWGSSLEWACQEAASTDPWDAASEVVKKLAEDEWGPGKDNIGVMAAREMFGNPFRPVAFADTWRTETAVALAAGIYIERAFDRLPILADALEEAGCDDPAVLSHCRGPGPHARGCWVVDGVLGRV